MKDFPKARSEHTKINWNVWRIRYFRFSMRECHVLSEFVKQLEMERKYLANYGTVGVHAQALS
jgi:hypothetical protein